MILHFTFIGLCLSTRLAASEAHDLLRFINGDQLHGSFQGIELGGLSKWQRDDLSEPAIFKASQLRHIVLHQGQPSKPLGSLASISLVNGDQIPGSITALTEDAITVQTSFGAPLTLPRDQVTLLAPSPTGGRLHYYGPFSEDGWKKVSPAYQDGVPLITQTDAATLGHWTFRGASWIWSGDLPSSALIRENALPERSILRFDLDWKNQLFAAVAFQADFTKPKSPGPDEPRRRAGGLTSGDPTLLPILFGNSYVLQLFSNHVSLFRTTISDDGTGVLDRIQLNSNPLRIGVGGKASVEIRSNRPTGEVSLFVNGEFISQWTDPTASQASADSPSKTGSGLGFLIQTQDAPLKISDIMISEWNGMPDAARSLQVDEQDIILLTNGTDRFAGHVATLEKDLIHVTTKLGKFQIPLGDIAEIRFAKKRLATPPEPSPESLSIRFSPFGKISGVPLTGSPSAISLRSAISGETTVRLDSAVMLEFQPNSNSTTDWDAE